MKIVLKTKHLFQYASCIQLPLDYNRHTDDNHIVTHDNISSMKIQENTFRIKHFVKKSKASLSA